MLYGECVWLENPGNLFGYFNFEFTHFVGYIIIMTQLVDRE